VISDVTIMIFIPEIYHQEHVYPQNFAHKFNKRLYTRQHVHCFVLTARAFTIGLLHCGIIIFWHAWTSL